MNELLHDPSTLGLDRAAWKPLKWHPQRIGLWNCQKKSVYVKAGRGSGKSEYAKRKLVTCLPQVKPWSDPRYFYAAATYQQAKRIAWFDFLRLIPKWWIVPHGASQTELCIRTIWGSELWVIGMDKPMRIEGVQWDGVVIDEMADQKPGIDRSVLPATTWRKAWVWKMGAPKRFGIGAHAFKLQFRKAHEAMEKEKETGEPTEMATFCWSSEEVLPQGMLDMFRAEMDPADYAEQFRAEDQELGGGVYHNFSTKEEEGNVRPCPYHPELPILVGSDFNVDPMAWSLAHKVGKHLEVFDEIHLRNANTYSMLNALWTMYGTHAKGWEFLGDSTSRNRKTSAVMTDYMILFNDERFKHSPGGRQVSYLKSNPPLSDRFACVNALICNGLGQRRLFIDPHCKHLINDYSSRQFKEGTRELPANEGAIGHHADSVDYIIIKKFPLKMNFADAPTVVIANQPGVTGYQDQSAYTMPSASNQSDLSGADGYDINW